MKNIMSLINKTVSLSTAVKNLNSLKKRSLKIEPLEERQLLSVNVGEMNALEDMASDSLIGIIRSDMDLMVDLGEYSPNLTATTDSAITAPHLNSEAVGTTYEIKTEAELRTVLRNIQIGSTIQLVANIDLTDTFFVGCTKDFTLDLNGHVLKQTIADSVIFNEGTLTIIDSQDGKEEAIHYFNVDDNGLWTLAEDQSVPTDYFVKGGCITGGTGHLYNGETYGGGIYNRSTLNMSGGTIVGNTVTKFGGGIFNAKSQTLTITNGTIMSNTGSDGGGVYNNGSLTIAGGTINSNTGEWGGGVYNCGETRIIDGVITGNKANIDGGGVFSGGSKTSLTIAGGTISENSAGKNGGGVASLLSRTTITGGTITKNRASNFGGGIMSYAGSSVTITGGTITKNSAPKGGGISCWTSLTIGGNTKIIENTLLDGSLENNILVNTEQLLDISTESPLEEGAQIGVSMYGSIGSFANNAKESDVTFFKSDNEHANVEFDSQTSTLKLTHQARSYAIHNDADDGIGSLRWVLNYRALDGDTIYIAVKEIKLNSSLSINKAVNIDGGNGVTLNGQDKCRILNICVDSDAKVALKQLTFINSSDTALSIGETNVVVTNCIFQNNTSYKYDAGAVSLSNATAEFNNCLLTGNKTEEGYGACYIHNSNVTMNNCTLTENSATNYGSAIYAISDSDKPCTVTLNNSIIVNNDGLDSCEVCAESNNTSIKTNYVLANHSNLWNVEEISRTIEYEPDYRQLFRDTENNDYHIVKDSQAQNAGDSSLVPEYITTDLDGNPRVLGNTVDLGAYEFLEIQYNITGYSGVFDGQEHEAVTIEPLYEGATVLYSVDGGEPTTELPIYRDVCQHEITVTIIRKGYDEYIQTVTCEITKANVTVSDVAVVGGGKVYDATTGIDVTYTSTGIIDPDKVLLKGSANFTDKNVGINKNVTATFSLEGEDADNYTLNVTQTTLTANINAKELTVKDTTVDDKTYDGNVTATVKAGTLNGICEGDQGKVIINTAVGTFNDGKNIGTNKAVTVVYTLSGEEVANYTVLDSQHTATINPYKVSVSSTTALDKYYDGTTNATIEHGELIRPAIEGDDVQISSCVGRFTNPYVGESKDVIVRYTLNDTNYCIDDVKVQADILLPTEVTTLEDSSDLSDGKYSLREVINIANVNAAYSPELKEKIDACTITFADSLFTQQNPTGTITLTSDLSHIKYAYDIDGKDRITIDGNDKYSIFAIVGTKYNMVGSAENSVVLTGLTLTGGSEKLASAVKSDYAYVTVKNTVVTENTSESAGSMYLNHSVISVVNSTITGNKTTAGHGGAIYINSDSTVTLVNNTIVGNTANEGGAALYANPESNNSVTTYNNLIVGNGTGLASEQVQNVTISEENANLLSMATNEIFANELPNIEAGESWADWNPTIKSPSGAAKKAVLDNATVQAVFGVDSIETTWDNILDNYGNARTTINAQNSTRTMNIGSCEQIVQTQKSLVITQDENDIVFTFEYNHEDESAYSLSYKLTTCKADWSWAWTTVPMEVVTTQEGDTILQCKIKKWMLGSCLGYDYLLTETDTQGHKENLVSGNLKLSNTGAPVYTVTSNDYNKITLKFFNCNGNRLTEQQEALTVLDSRAFVNCKWSEWVGETTLAELLTQDSEHHVTRNNDGTYTIDLTDMYEQIPSGSTLQFKIYFNSNEVVNKLSTETDDSGTLTLKSVTSWSSVVLKQPTVLTPVVATVQGLTNSSVGVLMKYTDPSAEGIQISTRQFVNGQWTQWTVGTTEDVQKQYTISNLAVPNVLTQVRLQAVDPSEPLALKPSAYSILTTSLQTQKLNTPFMYYNGYTDMVTTFTSVNVPETVQGYQIEARICGTNEFTTVKMLGTQSQDWKYWTEEQIRQYFSADDLTAALNLSIGEQYVIQIQLQAISWGGNSLYTDSCTSLSTSIVKGSTLE